MQTEQERLFRPGVSLDRLHRAIAEQIRHVAVALDRHLLLMQLIGLRPSARMVGTMIEIIGGTAEDAEEMVVAALERTEIRQKTEVPLSDQRRGIARLLQQGRQGRMARRQADVLRSSGVDRLLQANRHTVLVSPGGKRRARGRTDRGVGIGLGKPQPLECETIHVRSRVVALPVTADIGVAEIVREDEYDVRLVCLRRPGSGKADPGQGQRACGRRLHETAAAERFLIVCHVFVPCVSALIGPASAGRAYPRRLLHPLLAVEGRSFSTEGDERKPWRQRRAQHGRR